MLRQSALFVSDCNCCDIAQKGEHVTSGGLSSLFEFFMNRFHPSFVMHTVQLPQKVSGIKLKLS